MRTRRREGFHRAGGSLIAGLAVVVLAGCVSANWTVPGYHVTLSPAEAAQPDPIEQQLREHEQRWRGTPYRWGGTSREGMDCSGFVMTVFQDAFALPLPRTTAMQAEAGEAVPREALQAGDLVFFRPRRTRRHVGIYLGDGEFAHASTSRGVMISKLDDTYWRKAYWTSRRVLPPGAAPAPVSAVPPEKRSSKARTGW